MRVALLIALLVAPALATAQEPTIEFPQRQLAFAHRSAELTEALANRFTVTIDHAVVVNGASKHRFDDDGRLTFATKGYPDTTMQLRPDSDGALAADDTLPTIAVLSYHMTRPGQPLAAVALAGPAGTWWNIPDSADEQSLTAGAQVLLRQFGVVALPEWEIGSVTTHDVPVFDAAGFGGPPVFVRCECRRITVAPEIHTADYNNITMYVREDGAVVAAIIRPWVEADGAPLMPTGEAHATAEEAMRELGYGGIELTLTGRLLWPAGPWIYNVYQAFPYADDDRLDIMQNAHTGQVVGTSLRTPDGRPLITTEGIVATVIASTVIVTMMAAAAWLTPRRD